MKIYILLHHRLIISVMKIDVKM